MVGWLVSGAVVVLVVVAVGRADVTNRILAIALRLRVVSVHDVL